MGIESSSATSELWGDLYSVFRYLAGHPDIPVRRVYFNRLDGNNFVRPSFQIKYTTFRNMPRHIMMKRVKSEVMVQYYADTEWEAISAAEVIVDLLGGWPEAILPKYDFTQTPPAKISISGLDEYGNVVPGTAGIRIDPESVKADPFETEDHKWQVPVTFTMESTRFKSINPKSIVTAISYDLLTSELTLPIEVEAITTVAPSVTVL